MMHAKKGAETPKRTCHSGGNRRKMSGLNMKACIAVFLSMVMVFTSIDYMQVQASEVSVEETVETSEDSGEGGGESEGAAETEQGTEIETASDESEESTVTETDSTEIEGNTETGIESAEEEEGTETVEDSSETEESTETSEESTETREESTETESEETEEETTQPEETVEESTEEQSENPAEMQFVKTPEGAIILSGFGQLSKQDSCIVLEEKGTLEEVTAKMPSVLKAYAYAYMQMKETETESGTEGESESRPKETGSGSEEENETDESDVEAEGEPAVEGESESTEESTQEVPDREETDTALETTETVSGTENETESESETVPEIESGSAEVFQQELEVPVTWECEEDYENTGLEFYHFRPVWDESAYFSESDSVPTILVSIDGEEKDLESVVAATQEELAEALAAGKSKILLAADISLTATLTVPASADTILDGQGFSLYRGADENGAFLGTMICLGGEDYTKDRYGKLSLTNICIDGQTAENRAGAPTIIDHGCLVMEEGAVIRNNYNYGTYLYDADAKPVEVMDDFGGGIQVYGELVVTKESLITNNFADEFGGGVFLAGDSVLYLYADVIRENSVPAGTGYGADIYASDGSTIYYDSSVDMEREGFYICPGAILVCMQQVEEDEAKPQDGKIEIYISVAKGSGYTDEQIEEIVRRLEAKGYTVLTDKKVDIDTTDLRDWYVYDHYDTAVWGVGTNGNAPQSWLDEYGGNDKRTYYACTETWYPGSLNLSSFTVSNPAYTIAEWLERIDDYRRGSELVLAQFKEHIYTRNQDSTPMMTFVGYGVEAYVDFLYYDPESNGEKVVDFDVDSLAIDTHTLAGNGFLINTGVENGKIDGYLVYYAYDKITTTTAMPIPDTLEVYRLNGISVDTFHGNYNLKGEAVRKSKLGAPIAKYAIDPAKWEKKMSVQIEATPSKIEIRQQPASESASTNIAQSEPVLSCELTATGYSGFGPLVAYTSHNCSSATTFTYSDLRMYYTNPELEKTDMLNPLEQADFTQEGTQKYFLNLFGSAGLEYNDTANFGQYQEYLRMMQEEGIALITDRDTPFDDYLGEGDQPDSNLHEMVPSPSSIDDLVSQIISFIGGKTTTDMEDKLEENEDDGGLKRAEPKQSVGNIWLKSLADNTQIRTLYGNSFGDTGYAVQIMDDITYYDEDAANLTVKYYIRKPDSSSYEPLTSLSPSTGNIEYLTPTTFVIQKDTEEWPEGQYVVRQNISHSSIRGYAYFDLTWDDEPEPPEPSKPKPKPPQTPTPDPPVEEHVESISAPTETAVRETVVVKAVPSEPVDEPSPEPKTGDALPALPISVGACTAFMLKIRLWLYEMELGISEEKKNEILQALFSWARGTTKPRVYMAVGASAVILTIYHLLKALDEKRKRMVERFGK